MPTPPPTPGGGVDAYSRKRILPAFLLCFTGLGIHRFYVGKIISGIIQIVCVLGGSLWFRISARELIAMVQSSPINLDTITLMSEWEQAHLSEILPSIGIVFAVGLWIAVDAGRLLAGKFTDGEGKRITRWL